MLNRVAYTPEINHGVLMEMAEYKKDLERRTKPIADTLRSYQDLPPVCPLSFFLLGPRFESWSPRIVQARVRLATNTLLRPRTERELSALGMPFFFVF